MNNPNRFKSNKPNRFVSNFNLHINLAAGCSPIFASSSNHKPTPVFGANLGPRLFAANDLLTFLRLSKAVLKNNS